MNYGTFTHIHLSDNVPAFFVLPYVHVQTTPIIITYNNVMLACRRADLPNSSVRLLQPLLGAAARKGPKQPAASKESPPLRWVERLKE